MRSFGIMLKNILGGIIATLALVACATEPNAENISGARLVFQEGNQTITLFDSMIEINGTEYDLDDCGDGNVFCRKNNDIEFYIEIFHRCPDESLMSAPVLESDRMVPIQVVPHSDRIVYAVRLENGRMSKFRFEISQSKGLMRIEYFDSDDWASEDKFARPSQIFFLKERSPSSKYRCA